MGIRKGNYSAVAGSGDIEEGRFVNLTSATRVVDYTGAALASDAITLGRADAGNEVAIQFLNQVHDTFFYTADGIIAIGADIEVGADGKGTTQSAGVVVGIANKATTTDLELAEGYNK